MRRSTSARSKFTRSTPLLPHFLSALFSTDLSSRTCLTINDARVSLDLNPDTNAGRTAPNRTLKCCRKRQQHRTSAGLMSTRRETRSWTLASASLTVHGVSYGPSDKQEDIFKVTMSFSEHYEWLRLFCVSRSQLNNFTLFPRTAI